MFLCIYSEIAPNRSLQRPKASRSAKNENYLACLKSGASLEEKSMGAESGCTGVEKPGTAFLPTDVLQVVPFGREWWSISVNFKWFERSRAVNFKRAG